MLEEILKEGISRTNASNQPIFSLAENFDLLSDHKRQVQAEWHALSEEDKKNYSNLNSFENSKGVRDLKDPMLIPAKNASLLLGEIKKRLDREDPLKRLGIEPLDFDESVIELAESVENIQEIREIYRIRKASVGAAKNSGINSDEAAKIKNCFSQGRELYIAGKNGSLMLKPLNYFYALTAYSYGIIILNNPLRYRKDMLPGSHGMAYLPATIQAQFGGDMPRGTFSDLVGAFPTQLINRGGVSFNIDCSESIMNFYENRFDVSLGTLISLIPEMSEYYKLTTGRNSRCYPLEISNANDLRSLTWEFHIGNGETRPSLDAVKNAFPDFEMVDRFGKYIVTVPASRASSIKGAIYTDLRGELWFIDNPFHPIVLPEVAVHFLITSIFSNVMRYRPDEWGSVLLNEVSSAISLLTRHYFSTFQRKFMLIVLRSISRYIPYAT